MSLYQTALTIKSTNKKTGSIPVSTTTAKTCPTTCPFNNSNAGGCYADSGPLAIHWRKVTAKERGNSFAHFLVQIENFKSGQMWRHNQAGDLPGNGKKLDKKACDDLSKANKGKKGYTYTHYDPSLYNNSKVIQSMNNAGFTVNLSGNNAAHAIELKKKYKSAPVVSVVSSNHFDNRKNSYKKNSVHFVRCPADYNDKVNCKSCKLCAMPTRKSVICFPAHGTGKKRINNLMEVN